MRVNVDGVVYGTRAAIRAMERRGGGAIVATARSPGSSRSRPTRCTTSRSTRSSASSAASPRRSLAMGITANTVNPGMTDTNILSEEAKRALRAKPTSR